MIRIIIGCLLLIEGTVRIVIGSISGSIPLIAGGIVTGWILGVYLIYKGYKARFYKAEDNAKNQI